MTEVYDKNQKTQYADLMEYPFGYLATMLIKKALRRISMILGRAPKQTRMTWDLVGVSDADGPTANVRNYIEQSTLRMIMQEVTGGKTLKKACEVGCGYGRVIMVLKEFSQTVKGFEREPKLVTAATPLLPDIDIQRIDDITALPDDGEYDFAMTSTVLQHLTMMMRGLYVVK